VIIFPLHLHIYIYSHESTCAAISICSRTWAYASLHYSRFFSKWHQQKIFPSGWNGSVRVNALRQSRRRHPGGGLLHDRRQFNASRSRSPSDHCFTVSSRSVGLLFLTITLALWPTVSIRRNGFIG
jgi:hypothetical protein